MYKFRQYFLTIALFVVFFSQIKIVDSKTIIWDLGNTLFTVSKFKFARDIGFSYFIKYAILDLKNPNIQPLIFDILNKINPAEEYPSIVAADNEGRPLPIIMDKWLAGVISDQELMQSVNDFLGHLDKQKYFISEYQKTLVQKTLAAMFNPKILANTTEPIMAGIELLHDCHQAKNSDGTPKNVLFVLSNWDEASFGLVKQKYAHIFDTYFLPEHVIISGNIGLIKPQKAAYEYIINTYELDRADCIFIDDQYLNTLAAQTVGIQTLHLCHGNYSAIKNILTIVGAL